MFEAMYDEDPLYMFVKFSNEQLRRYMDLNSIKEVDLNEEEKKELQELYEYASTPPDNLNNQQK